jgi:Zinc-binding dehydrogenase
VLVGGPVDGGVDSHFAAQARRSDDALEPPVRRDDQPQLYAGGVGLVPGLPELEYAVGTATGGTGHVDDNDRDAGLKAVLTWAMTSSTLVVSISLGKKRWGARAVPVTRRRARARGDGRGHRGRRGHHQPGARRPGGHPVQLGQFSARIARHLGVERVIGVDQVPERRAAAARFGVEAMDPAGTTDTADRLIEMTAGRGPDAVIDAVGMEAHGHQEAVGTKLAEAAQQATGLLPDRVAQKVTDVAAVDRLDAPHVAVKAVRRGGTVSVSGVYGGEIDPMPMMEMFDRGVQMRMGQAHVKRWIDDLMPLVADGSDPLGVTSFATHHLPLEQAPQDTRSSGTRTKAVSRSFSSRRPSAVSSPAALRFRSARRWPPAPG